MAGFQVITLIFVCCVVNGEYFMDYRRSVSSGYWYFKVHTVPKTWHEANLICQSENAYLAVINSVEEAEFFVEEVAKYPPESVIENFANNTPSEHLDMFMLGFHDILTHPNFFALDGIRLSETGCYFRWSENRPSNEENDEHCGCMTRDASLNHVRCDEPYMFICESRYPYSEESLPKNVPKCVTYENGYKLGSSTGDRFYKFHTEPTSWDVASLVCQTEQAKLAVLKSSEDIDIFMSELQSYPAQSIPGNFNKDYVLLGFHDRIQHGNYITLDGTPLQDASYYNWLPAQPDEATEDERCGSFSRWAQYKMVSCSSPYMYFCTKPAINSSRLFNSGLCTGITETFYNDEQIIDELECEYYELGYKRIRTTKGDKYIKLHLEPQTWDIALVICQSEQATLAEITSVEESMTFSSLISEHPMSTINGTNDNDIVILGFHDKFQKGHYEIVDGKPLTKSGFYRWSIGQPNIVVTGRRCGSMFRNGLLNAVDCDSPYIFLCEKSSIRTFIPTDLREDSPLCT